MPWPIYPAPPEAAARLPDAHAPDGVVMEEWHRRLKADESAAYPAAFAATAGRSASA